MAPVSALKGRTVPGDGSSVRARPAGTGSSMAVQRPRMEEERPRYSGLYKLSFRLHCLLGGPLLNTQELTILCILIISMATLAAAGAFKQLTRLTDGLLA